MIDMKNMVFYFNSYQATTNLSDFGLTDPGQSLECGLGET